MTRRRFLTLSAAAGATASIWPVSIEPRWPEITHTKVTFHTSLPAPIRILHLSDLHASWFTPFSIIENAIKIGLQQKPDIVCLTGDFISKGIDFDDTAYARILRQLPLAAPTFAVLGNHDGGIWAGRNGGLSDQKRVRRVLKNADIHLLDNEPAKLTLPKSGDITLGGVGDLWSQAVHPARAFARTSPGHPVIALAHNPDTKDKIAEYHWDLLLSGHTHGGQIILPFDGPRFAPVRDKRYVSGLGRWGSRQIYVTRGVGGVAAGIRFRCRPEITILDVA